MTRPVKKLQDGRWITEHLHNMMYEVYTFIVAFNLGKGKSMELRELCIRLKLMHKYQHLSTDEIKEMLVALTSISFLFRTEIVDETFFIRERLCY